MAYVNHSPRESLSAEVRCVCTRSIRGILSVFADLHPVTQALAATLFTWGLTALGAGMIFFANAMKMIAASF